MSVNGGAYTPLANPSLFKYTATTLDPVTLQAMATDLNGNTAESDVITLVPYDGTDGVPEVALLAPEDGAEHREREQIQLEVVLRNVASAELYLDMGGVEATEPHETIAVSEGDPERFPYPLSLPSVDESTAATVRRVMESDQTATILTVFY